MVNMI
jgi:hypothetical protein